MARQPEGFQVRGGDDFYEAAVSLFGSYQIVDELLYAYDHVLSRDPFLGFRIQGSNIWMLELNTVPKAVLFYAVDALAKTIEYRALKALESQNDG